MADNTELNVASGGDTIATDDIGGVKHQQVKLEYGPEGTATPVTLISGLPMQPINSVSEANSTATALIASDDFTGTGEDVSSYASITVFIESDVSGSISMEFSTNNFDWDRKKVVEIDTFIGQGSVHNLSVVAKYF